MAYHFKQRCKAVVLMLALAALAVLVLEGLSWLRLGSSEFQAMLFVLTLIALFVAGTVMVLSQNLRVQARLDAACGRLCFRCGEALPVANDTRPCPWCGRACEAWRDADLWRKSGFVVPDPHEPPTPTNKQPPPPPDNVEKSNHSAAETQNDGGAES